MMKAVADRSDLHKRRRRASLGAFPAADALERQTPRALDLLPLTGDAGFAIDGAGRISAWNAAAEQLFGYRGGEVIGRFCYEVLGCRDLEDREPCGGKCPRFESIRVGKPPAPVDILARHRAGHAIEVSESTILFPDALDTRAILLLRPCASGIVEVTSANGMVGAPDHPRRRPDPQVDLAGTLDRLLIVTGADAVELFLVAPAKGQLVLAMHRGQAARAFREILEFDRGQGFPGLVAEHGEAVVSLDLAHDDRYLRSKVKHQGFRSYLCVPVRGPSGLLGSLHIASRRGAETVMPYLPFLSRVARELGSALELERLRAAELVASQPWDPTADAGANLKRVGDRALGALIDVAGADCGVLLLHNGASSALEVVSEHDLPTRLRRAFARACARPTCPVVVEQRCVLPGETGRAEWPLCRLVQRDLPSAVCLPLAVGEHLLGIVVLGCRRRESLPTRHLSFLHAAVNQAAIRIHNAQVALREERAARLQTTGERSANGMLAGRASTETMLDADARRKPVGDVPFLDLRCLGQLTIVADGRTIPAERFPRRRSLTLLKILLTRYGKPVHREELIELMWPGANPDAARSLLNVVVHYLRHGLEPDAPSGQPSHFIRTNGEYYAFDSRSLHQLDTQQFLEAVRTGAQLDGDGRTVEALAACRRAIALYRGDFLEDELYSDWCSLEREYFRESFLTTLRRASRLHLRQGEVDAAVGCYRRALLTDATLEDVHRDLMRALWQAGRRDEALRQYRECRAILERELSAAPLPETEQLFRRILSDSVPNTSHA